MKLIDGTDTESVLVFTRTKHRTTRVATQMKRAGFAVASLQGDLSQNRRQAALEGFRSGKYRILVATDIAARGIDITRISHVINYDMPDTVDAYTHRIGRTGRAAKTGDAFTFATPEDRALVGNIENVLGEKIERRTLENFDYTAPAPAGSGGSGGPHYPARYGSPAKVTGRSLALKGSDLPRQVQRVSGARKTPRSLEGFPLFLRSSKAK
jgi:superfamily II DNA/RNA helicase